ncbi:hypothetical protein MMC11_006434 [Xylographa trunciseda]|nr:hypothetical protein [Xylographa trunciseda]
MSAKFDPFTIHTTSYKIVNGYPIDVDILVPKDIKAGKRPLLVRFHGGYMVTGASLFPNFFPNWILELATSVSAVVVSADYQLLPEGNGKDMLADIADLWKWVRSDLQPYLEAKAPTVEIDLQRILVAGDSGGAYLAVQSALTQPTNSFKAIVGLYPELDLDSDFFTKKYEKSPFGMPMVPEAVLDTHVNAMEKGVVVSSAIPPARLELALSMVQNGRVLEFLGSDETLLPVEMVGKVDSMPPVLILHGKDDSAVPVEGSERFVRAFKKKHPSTPVRLDVQPGDHGFDSEATLDTPWLKEDVKFIMEHWLA